MFDLRLASLRSRFLGNLKLKVLYCGIYLDLYHIFRALQYHSYIYRSLTALLKFCDVLQVAMCQGFPFERLLLFLSIFAPFLCYDSSTLMLTVDTYDCTPPPPHPFASTLPTERRGQSASLAVVISKSISL